MINDQRTTITALHKHRIALILWVVTDPDFCARGVSQRIAPLFVVQKLRRLEVDAVQGVKVKDYLVSASGGFAVDDSPVGDSAMLQKESAALGDRIRFLLTLEQTQDSHQLVHDERRLIVSRTKIIDGRKYCRPFNEPCFQWSLAGYVEHDKTQQYRQKSLTRNAGK